MNVPTAFTLRALANACRMPFGIFSNAVVFTLEAFASVQRIATFFAADEIKLSSSETIHEPLMEGQSILEIHDANFAWTSHHSASSDSIQRPILRNITSTVAPGSLTIIVGAVGSGKSSLVRALIGEMGQLRGMPIVSWCCRTVRLLAMEPTIKSKPHLDTCKTRRVRRCSLRLPILMMRRPWNVSYSRLRLAQTPSAQKR